MAVSESFRIYVLEQLERVTPVVDRRMFGGVGIYSEGYFFAVIDDNTVYFKVDDSNRRDYEVEDMPPFRPYGPEGPAMSYYQLPSDVLEDPDKLRVWVAKAVDVARKNKKGKHA